MLNRVYPIGGDTQAQGQRGFNRLLLEKNKGHIRPILFGQAEPTNQNEAPPPAKPPQKPKPPGFLPRLVIGLGIFMGMNLVIDRLYSKKPEPIAPVKAGEVLPDIQGLLIASPKELLQKVQQDHVKSIGLAANDMTLYWRINLKNNTVQYFVPNPQQEGFNDLVKTLREKGIHPKIEDPSIIPQLFNAFIMLSPLLFIIVILVAMRKSQGGLMGGLMKNNRFQRQKELPNTTLKDVAGMDEVVEEIREDFLPLFDKNVSSLGEKRPKGMLLSGPPGTGKTLLARAIAGELKRPFFSISGSDFVQMFVGLGASRVREIFDAAKAVSPSVIFIDELDAVGRERGRQGIGGGHDEREQTLNALLTEMDGFTPNDDVLVIAATNQPDVLDKALLRPGRFDKKYTVDAPMTPKGRKEILDIHVRDKKIGQDVDTMFLARRMAPGTTGAEIANIANEAALLACRRKATAIGQQDFLKAIEKVYYGLAKKDHGLEDKDKHRTSQHEAVGHGLTAWAQGLPPQFLTVVPRSMGGKGTALGMMGYDMDSLPKYFQTPVDIEKLATIIMGGRAAEESVYGERGISSGASNDWEKVNDMMRNAIEVAAMYPELFGQLTIKPSQNPFGIGEGPSEALKQKAEKVRDQKLTELYKITLAFQRSIPDAARQKIVETLEQEETINDPIAIKNLFDACGVDWQDLWKRAEASVHSDNTRQS